MNYKGIQFTNEANKTVVIDIDGSIGPARWWDDNDKANSKERLKAELKKIAELKAETIIVNINSYGGDVNHGISIHDLLAEHSAKIITNVTGMTASIATVIAMAGDERRMSDNALFLVHNASSAVWGDKNDIKSMAADLEKIDDKIASIYSKRTGKEKQEMLDLMNAEKGMGKWLTADEAQEYGFITEIYEPVKAAAYFSNDILIQNNLPGIPEEYQSTSGTILETIRKEVSSLRASIANLINNKKTDNFSNSNEMDTSKFKIIVAILGGGDLVSNKGKLTLTEDQVQLIEDKLAESETLAAVVKDLPEGKTVANLNDQIANLENERNDLTAEKTRLEAEVEALSKATVDETGADGKDGDGKPKLPTDPQAAHFYELSKIS